MKNSFLGKRYRLLRGSVEREVLRRWGALPLNEVARKVGLSVPTLRRMMASQGVYNEVTLRRVEDALAVPRILLATAVDEGDGAAVPDISKLADLPSAAIQSLLRSAGGLFTAYDAARRAKDLIHWALGLNDEHRPHRRLVRTSNVPFGGAYACVDVEPSQGSHLDLVVSMVLPMPMSFDVAIDYGRLLLRAGRWRSDDIIGRETLDKPAGQPPCFITFAPGAMSTPFLIRGNVPFEARVGAYLPVKDGEERLRDGSDPLVGFRARGLFHVDGAERA